MLLEFGQFVFEGFDFEFVVGLELLLLPEVFLSEFVEGEPEGLGLLVEVCSFLLELIGLALEFLGLVARVSQLGLDGEYLIPGLLEVGRL